MGGAVWGAVALAVQGLCFRATAGGGAWGGGGAVAGIATALGPVLGGLITTEWNWRGIFLINVPVGVLALVVTWRQVEESRSPHAPRLDLGGFALLTTGLVSLVYGFIRAGEYDRWSDTGVIICLAIGVLALAAFIGVESRIANPMFDVTLFRIPTFSGASIAAFAMNGSLYAILLYLVLYLQDAQHYSALGAGVRIAIISGAQFVTATIAGKLSHRVPARWLIGPGLLLVGVGLLLMTGLTASSSWTHLIPGFIVAGLGGGMVNPPLASTAISVVPPQRAGMASGGNTTFRQIGIAAGIAVLGTVFASHARTDFTGGLNDLFVITGVLALAGGALSMLLIRPARQQAPAPVTATPAMEEVTKVRSE
jgi:MFS family permease